MNTDCVTDILIISSATQLNACKAVHLNLKLNLSLINHCNAVGGEIAYCILPQTLYWTVNRPLISCTVSIDFEWTY